jgi:hypothetical protein
MKRGILSGMLATVMMLAMSLPMQAQREYPCFQLPVEPVLDGKTDDSAWQNIPEAAGFFINGKTEFAVKRLTHFKAGWTKDSLHLAIRCVEPSPDKIKAEQPDGGNLWEDDDMEIFLLPPGAAVPIQLIVNAKGSRWNGMGEKIEKLLDWKAAASIGKNEWVAALKIPFTVLQKTPAVNDTWKFSIARTVNSDPTSVERYTNWPRLMKGFIDVPNFASLAFKGAPPTKIEVNELERQMNDHASSLQKELQGMLRDVTPIYQKFERTYDNFKEMASPQLQKDAAELKKNMGIMEKAATSKTPDLKEIEAALNINPADRLEKAIARCCVKVSLANYSGGTGPWQDDGKYHLWSDLRDGAPTADPTRFTFNCDEQTLAGKNSTKLDYAWTAKGGRVLVRAPAPVPPSGNFEPHLGIWVYGNGSGDTLYDTPIDWIGWRYVDVKLYTIPYPSYILILNHNDETTSRKPIYFGSSPIWYDAGVGKKTLLESPATNYPFPFYLADDEVLSFGINNGLYDVEVGLDTKITGGVMPKVYINESLANEKAPTDIVKYQCELKDGSLRVRANCENRKFSGVRYVKLSRKNQTVAYCDATVLSQTQKAEEIRGTLGYVPIDPFSSLETNAALFEQDLGGKQLNAASRIVYQFKLKSGDYTVRLRFNRWRGTYPGDAKFDVFLQGDKVMEMRKPNTELLSRDFNVKVADGYMQVAVLGAVPDACAWLGDISVLQGGKMVGFLQPRPSIPEAMNGDYLGLRNLVPNPSFEVEEWQRNWASLSPKSKTARTNTAAHHGSWSLCLEPTSGPAGLIFNLSDSRRPGSPSCSGTLLRRIKDGVKLADISKDERFEGASCVGGPIDYTRPYRFSGWVKTENATDQAYLQIVWIASPRPALADKPLIPESPKLRAMETYFTILGVSESVKVSGSPDWQKITVEAKPPYGASQAQFILRSDDNKGKVYFDDLEFDGFGSNPLEIILPQIGYHPNGEKLALVKTRSPIEKGEFQLNDASGKTVYSGNLKSEGADAWGIYLSRADFSKWRVEGQFTLKVTAKDLPVTTTPAFAVSSSLYRDLGMLSINSYFHSARCGTEIPGWHAACHLDMAAIRNDYDCGKQPEYLDKSKPKGAIIKLVDLTGGWHDAGSLDKYGNLMAPAAIAMCRFWEDTHFVSKDLKEKYPDVLSEASWGVDYIMRSIDKENNKFYDNPIEWNPITKDYKCLGSDPTDNIKNTADDPVCRAAIDLKKEKNDPKAIRPVALTRLANSLREYDETKAKELLEMAALWNADGNFALALARYLANGKKKDELSKLEALAEKTIAPYRSERYPSFLAGYAVEGNFTLLFDYLEICPDTKIGKDFKSLVRRICDEILKPLAENNPYGAVDQMAEPVMTRAFTPSPDQNSVSGIAPGKYLEIAYFLIRAGCLLDDPELIRLGERHIQYMLGRNPQGLSMVGGAGYRVCSIATLLFPYGSKWIENKGQIPGSVGTLSCVSDGSRNWLYSLGPLDFPIPQTASELVNTFAGSGEVYEVPTGMLIAVCGALDWALKEKGSPGEKR